MCLICGIMGVFEWFCDVVLNSFVGVNSIMVLIILVKYRGMVMCSLYEA